MAASIAQTRIRAAIAATVAGLLFCVTPAYAADDDNVVANDGHACGGGGRPALASYEPTNDVNEGEMSWML